MNLSLKTVSLFSLLPLLSLSFGNGFATEKFPVQNHSFSTADVVITHIDLDLNVDFAAKKLWGEATLHIANKTSGKKLFLDTNELTIKKVTLDEKKQPTTFTLGEVTPFLGQALVIDITPTTKTVNIQYETSPQAAAIQWLEPSQTEGKKMPYMFTQGEAILARTWFPCQDTPQVRMTYNATIHTPKGMLAIMSAENSPKKNPQGIYTFKMPQAIPSYLFALAVGDIAFEPIDKRTGVYSEPAMVKKAAWEFANLGNMVNAAEKIYGPYSWGRYDVLVLPQSFPFGGMENPRLNFVSPTLITGDRSQVYVVTHELAHSWSGNLVTNATWDDFWINEGFTNYFERRIIESIDGKEQAEINAMLGFQRLNETIADKTMVNGDTPVGISCETVL
jgi:aminopeptidase N